MDGWMDGWMGLGAKVGFFGFTLGKKGRDIVIE